MADLKKALAEEKEYLVSIRREFHRHPEVSLKEFRTAKRIEEELEQFGIPHTRVGETGVLGTPYRTGSEHWDSRPETGAEQRRRRPFQHLDSRRVGPCLHAAAWRGCAVYCQPDRGGASGAGDPAYLSGGACHHRRRQAECRDYLQCIGGVRRFGRNDPDDLPGKQGTSQGTDSKNGPKYC